MALVNCTSWTWVFGSLMYLTLLLLWRACVYEKRVSASSCRHGDGPSFCMCRGAQTCTACFSLASFLPPCKLTHTSPTSVTGSQSGLIEPLLDLNLTVMLAWVDAHPSAFCLNLEFVSVKLMFALVVACWMSWCAVKNALHFRHHSNAMLLFMGITGLSHPTLNDAFLKFISSVWCFFFFFSLGIEVLHFTFWALLSFCMEVEMMSLFWMQVLST